jgi:hypothetical protein
MLAHVFLSVLTTSEPTPATGDPATEQSSAGSG